jgi:hypothetical protein
MKPSTKEKLRALWTKFKEFNQGLPEGAAYALRN